MTVTISYIREAARCLDGLAVRTPLLESPYLNALTGARVLLKAENLQRTGSFKFRGAYHCLATADRARLANGVVAWSSGNHAQGVAAAAELLGVAATIVMPRDAPAMKVERTRRHGAEIVFYDRYTEDREAIGRNLAAEKDALLVPSYDDAAVIAGQGTVGLEIADQSARRGLTPEKILVCCGGGGLTAGVGLAVRERFSECRIYTVEPDGFDDTRRSLASGRYETNATDSRSICDALLTPSPGRMTLPILRSIGVSGLTVSDDAAAAAVKFALNELKLVVEPGGAVALAAALNAATSIVDRTVVVVLSGGNVDPAILETIIRR